MFSCFAVFTQDWSHRETAEHTFYNFFELKMRHNADASCQWYLFFIQFVFCHSEFFCDFVQLKLIAKTNAAKKLEKQQMSADIRRSELNRRSINAAELNFALQTGSLHRIHRASETHSSSPSMSHGATTPPQIAPSNEKIELSDQHADTIRDEDTVTSTDVTFPAPQAEGKISLATRK